MVGKFDNFIKTVAVYHGFGGEPAQDRISLLKSLGIINIYYPHINYEKEWKRDHCKSICQRELRYSKEFDLVIGLSLGGHLAYLISQNKTILINPALDRERSKLEIKEFDCPPNVSKQTIEAFFGENDNVVTMKDQVSYLTEQGANHRDFLIKNMEHRTPIDKFQEILNMSNFINGSR